MGSETEPTTEGTPWLRLHTASLAVNLLPMAWRTLRGAWPLLLALVIGGGGLGMQAFDLALLVGFFALTLVNTTLHWFTLRYRIQAGRLEIKSGLFNRRSRVLDPARIQNIELVQNLFHRATGLVEVRIETAGDASTEGLLSALSQAQAARLQAELQQLVGRAPRATPEEEAAKPALVEMGLSEILAYGFSRRSIGAVAVMTAVAMEVLGRLGPQATDEVAWAMQPRVLLAAIVLAFALSWIFSAGTALFRHYGFRLVEDGARLVTVEGLTTRRRVEIPRAKVQLVRADEPLLRRLMGYGTVLIETAGLGISDGRVRQAEGVVPMVTHDELPTIFQRAVPVADTDPWQATLLPAHPRALWRAVLAGLARNTLLAAVLIAFFRPWGWGALVLLPLSIPIAWLDWRFQAWLVTPSVVIARRGFFTRRTWLVSRDKVQSVHLIQSPMMRWHRLGRVVVRVAGSQVPLPDIAIETARRVLQELSPHGATMSASGEQQLDGDDAADDTSDVGGQSGDDTVADAADTDGAEVHGEHVEGGLGGPVHGADQVADVAVGAVGIDELGGDTEGARPAQRAEQGQGQGLGREPEGTGHRADGLGDEVEAPARAEHPDGGQDGHQVRNDRHRKSKALFGPPDEDLVDLDPAKDAHPDHAKDEAGHDPGAGGHPLEVDDYDEPTEETEEASQG